MRVKPSHVVCAFQEVNIATLQCRQMREIEATHANTVERNRQIEIQVEKIKGEKQRSETEKVKETGVRRGKLRKQE